MQLPSNLWKSTAPTYLDLVLGLESAYPQELHGVQCEQQNGENKVTQCLYTLLRTSTLYNLHVAYTLHRFLKVILSKFSNSSQQ